jgi:pyruvate,water dikinase
MAVLDREYDEVLFLSQVVAPERFGAKAIQLADLARHGIPIPETLVMPAGSDVIPEDVVLRALGGCIAVRSSAIGADSEGTSFTGQFETVLNVRTAEELVRAIRKVRAAAGDAVRAYSPGQGVRPAVVPMAVILQRMLRAGTAGVLSTVDPITGCENDMLIEARCGQVCGVRIHVRDGKPAGPGELLSANHVGRIVELGRRIQRLKGCPQNVEWAIENDRVFILQARPLTCLGCGGIEGQWSYADFREDGVASDVVTPFMGSLYEFICNRTLKGFLKDLGLLDADFPATRIIYGRPYWNVAAVKQCAARLTGADEGELTRDISVKSRAPARGTPPFASLRGIFKALCALLAVRRLFQRQERRDREILSCGLPRHFDVDFQSVDDRRLLRSFKQLVEGAYRTIEENYLRTIFCHLLAKLDLKMTLPCRQQRGLEKQLRRLGTYFWLHEQMRDLSTLVYAQIRHLVLEIGKRAAAARRLVSADDVFYLHFREVYRVFEGESKGVVQSRRHYELMYRNFCAPNEVGRDISPAPPASPAHG